MRCTRLEAAQNRSFGPKGAGSDAVIDRNANEEDSYTRLDRALVHAKRITTNTYTEVPDRGDLADPSSKAAPEAPRAVGVGKYAIRTPSDNSIRKEHGPASNAETSTSTTAATVLGGPNSVPPGITVESIEKLVFEDEKIKDHMLDIDGAAKTIQRTFRRNRAQVDSLFADADLEKGKPETQFVVTHYPAKPHENTATPAGNKAMTCAGEALSRRDMVNYHFVRTQRPR
jgi:hypothetical protein